MCDVALRDVTLVSVICVRLCCETCVECVECQYSDDLLFLMNFFCCAVVHRYLNLDFSLIVHLVRQVAEGKRNCNVCMLYASPFGSGVSVDFSLTESYTFSFIMY